MNIYKSTAKLLVSKLKSATVAVDITTEKLMRPFSMDEIVHMCQELFSVTLKSEDLYWSFLSNAQMSEDECALRIREKVVYYFNNDYDIHDDSCKYAFHMLSEFVDSAFSWSSTDQGSATWSSIYKTLQEAELTLLTVIRNGTEC